MEVHFTEVRKEVYFPRFLMYLQCLQCLLTLS